ncbi:hypothetical protein D3C86_1974770 [compost metagenome]
MLLVLDGDALLDIVLAGDLETQGLTAVDLDLLAAGLSAQGQADDGDPALAVLLDHQQRFALVAGARRTGGRAQVDHGDAAGYRFVQQAADKAFGVSGQGEAEGD